tara:strand:- start:25 stop:450 length:426 start_codon:yes stop_codon:yes gene_type:complete
MALELKQAEFTYTSTYGTSTYTFTIVYVSGDKISVRNITTPFGLVQDPYSSLPTNVITDIKNATLQVLDTMSSSAINGIATFTTETEKVITFATPLDDTTYRVVFSIEDFVPVRVTSKTINGFTIEVGITYTGDVGYDVFI